MSHSMGGYDMTPNVIVQISVKVSMTVRFLVFVGSLFYHLRNNGFGSGTKLCFPNQNVKDPDNRCSVTFLSQTVPSFDILFSPCVLFTVYIHCFHLVFFVSCFVTLHPVFMFVLLLQVYFRWEQKQKGQKKHNFITVFRCYLVWNYFITSETNVLIHNSVCFHSPRCSSCQWNTRMIHENVFGVTPSNWAVCWVHFVYYKCRVVSRCTLAFMNRT